MIPVALGSLVTNLTSLLDLVTMMRCLGHVQFYHLPALTARYGDLAASQDFPAFVYGAFTGMAITVFNLVPSVTNMLGKSALPCAAALWIRQDTTALVQHTRSVLTASAAMALPAACGLGLLAQPVMHILYSSRPAEAALAAQALQALLAGMVCLCLTVPLCSILQGIGRAAFPVLCMLAGVAVKLAGNLLLIPRPEFCIIGAGISTSACYLLLLLLILLGLRRILGQPLHLCAALFPIVLASAGCCAAVLVCRNWLLPHGNLCTVAVCTLAGGTVYLAILQLFRLLQPKKAHCGTLRSTS